MGIRQKHLYRAIELNSQASQKEKWRSARQISRSQQSIDDHAMLQMRVDDFVDIGFVDVGVPNAFRIDHDHRTRGTAVQTTCPIDPYFAGPGQARRFDLRLAPIKSRLGPLLAAAGLTRLALVKTEEDVSLVETVADTRVGNTRRRRAVLDVAHWSILVSRLPTPRLGEDIGKGGIGPQPSQPLRNAVKSDEAPLLPILQGLRKVRVGRRLIDEAQVDPQSQ
jgi:hypothetical protein